MADLISKEFQDIVEAAKENSALPSYADVDIDESFEQLVKKRAEAAAHIKELEEVKAELDAALATSMEMAHVPACSAAGYKVALVLTSRSSLDKVALIEHGVKKSVIEECTKHSKSVSLRMWELKK
jgi:phage tail tape-measure protein